MIELSAINDFLFILEKWALAALVVFVLVVGVLAAAKWSMR